MTPNPCYRFVLLSSLSSCTVKLRSAINCLIACLSCIVRLQKNKAPESWRKNKILLWAGEKYSLNNIGFQFFLRLYFFVSGLLSFYLKLKYPIEGLSNSPINIALSSSIFDSSQQVSGNKAQLWQAARLHELGPCP